MKVLLLFNMNYEVLPNIIVCTLGNFNEILLENSKKSFHVSPNSKVYLKEETSKNKRLDKKHRIKN